MHRRARIKAVANLSASRRAANKGNSDVSNKTKENESEIIKSDIEINPEEQGKSSESLPVIKPHDNVTHCLTENNDVNVTEENEINVTEKCQETSQTEVLPSAIEEVQEIKYSCESSNALQHDTATFKTPLQIPRVDDDSSSSSTSVPSAIKHRRFKIAPRLIASRNTPRALDGGDEEKVEEADADATQTGTVETLADFTLPTPAKARPETPREVSDQPNFIVNHNIQHSGAPPSPFPYLSHGRIRTESLCSMKSNRDVTVANLQPRKNIRTEDQKIIDIKRESRERLSNKDLEKSHLTMFDLIYFNPQNNPMKPRDSHKTEKPKKVEVIPEVVEKIPEVKKEPSSIPVPQLRIDANGDMVLDETSLVVENEQQKQNRILLATTDVVYDDELSGNYGHYKRQQRTKEWTKEETVKFYRCLNTVGSDFSLMLNLFPNRCRRDLKLKFKKEEKNNSSLIDKALLNYNTFNLDELQREFDQEEEQRKKEAEEKSSSEVKELVKRKILKKQAAKLKAEQKSKSKIEKILADGNIALGIVDNIDVKENLVLDAARSSITVHKKRQYKRNPKKTEVVEESDETNLPTTVNIMDGLAAMSSDKKAAAVVKKSRQPRKKLVLSNPELNTSIEQEPPLKKLRGALKNSFKLDNSAEASSPIVVTHHIEAVTHESSKSFKPEKHSVPTVNDNNDSKPHWKLEQPGCSTISVHSQEDIPMDMDEVETYEISAALDVRDEFAGEFPQSQQEEIAGSMDYQSQSGPEQNIEYHVTDVDYNDSNAFDAPLVFYENVTSVDVEPPAAFLESQLPVAGFDNLPVVELPETSYAAASRDSKVSSPSKKSEKKPKPQRKKKIRPVLVSRLKLDKDGEMVLDDSSTISQKEETRPTPDSLCKEDELPSTSEVIPSFEEVYLNETPVDENLNETIFKSESSSAPVMITVPEEENPSSLSCETVREEFDGEAFLDSLDLERLVLVEAQRDGKDVYEIHEIDPDTQEIGEKPLDLPCRYVDLIISVMTQQEEEVEA